MLQQDELQFLVLSTVLDLGGKATLEEVAEILKDHLTLSLTDWRPGPNLETKWRLELRRAYHLLKDANQLQGLEIGPWYITPKGLERLHQSDNWIKARRARQSFERILRDTKQVQLLKHLYQHKCQVCGTQILAGPEGYLSEGHHLRPLGHPHLGPDIPANILVLCPNHHAQFDRGVLAIHPTTHKVHLFTSAEAQGDLFHSLHPLGKEFLNYHWENIYLETMNRESKQ